ncbi:peptidylprolyl isomerase [bacterium]|nr:peptidylprolyl isomerase [bacterium]
MASLALPSPSVACPLPRRRTDRGASTARHSRCDTKIRARLDTDSSDTDSSADTDNDNGQVFTRRASLSLGAALLASTSSSSSSATASEALGKPKITHRVFLDIGTCPSIVRADRAFGGSGALCETPSEVGRIEIGLFGDVVPNVVGNFLSLVQAPPGKGYAGTVFHRIKPGQYVLAGQAGSARMGQVQAPRFDPNTELLQSKSFTQKHLRPGTVSLALAAATGDGGGGPGSTNRNSAQTEFLITTGPAPVPSLDGQNVVFGKVLSGLEVVSAIGATPTFKPSSNSIAWNQVAEWVGDERAAKARESWSKPTIAVVIVGCGLLEGEV